MLHSTYLQSGSLVHKQTNKQTAQWRARHSTHEPAVDVCAIDGPHQSTQPRCVFRRKIVGRYCCTPQPMLRPHNAHTHVQGGSRGGFGYLAYTRCGRWPMAHNGSNQQTQKHTAAVLCRHSSAGSDSGVRTAHLATSRHCQKTMYNTNRHTQVHAQMHLFLHISNTCGRFQTRMCRHTTRPHNNLVTEHCSTAYAVLSSVYSCQAPRSPFCHPLHG